MKIAHWIGVAACVAAGMSLSGQLASSQQMPAASTPTLPWGEPADMIAWEEYVQITAPAGDPTSQKVEFETWASDEDIYVSSPAHWPSPSEPKVLQPSALAHAVMAGVRAQPQNRAFVFQPNSCQLPGGRPVANGGNGAADGSGFPVDACIGEEVRRNWASFRYIVSNHLDSHSGLAAAFAKNLKVDLPADAIEFKGDWAAVSDVAKWLSVTPDVVRAHYYTSTAVNGGKNTEVALLSFHISTKQIKNWVWSDFENSMTPGRCDVIGCQDSVGAVIKSVKPNPSPYKSYGECQKSPAVEAMMENAGIAPVFRNYCLKASQIAFKNDDGSAILLGNSVIEPLNAGVPIAVSSCITCHGYASFNKNGRINAYALIDPMKSPVGDVDQQHMQGYLSNDFIWGIVLQNMKN